MGRPRIHADGPARWKAYRARKRAKAAAENAAAAAGRCGELSLGIEARADVRALTPAPPPTDPVAAFIAYAERLRVPRGRLAGKPFRLLPWQVEFAALVLAGEAQTCCLSIARKNGKTGLLGLLVLARIDPASPLYGGPRWRALCISESEGRTEAVGNAIMSIAGSSGLVLVEKRAPRHTIESPGGAGVDFLASGKGAAHSFDCDWALIDEAGLLTRKHHRHIWSTAESSLSASDDPRFLICGTRLEGDLFAEALDQAKRGVAGCAALEYSAPDAADILDTEAWLAGNPSLGTIKSRQHFEGQAQRAADDPHKQPDFKAHHLNQPFDPDAQTIVSLQDWKAIESAAPPEPAGRCWVGIDIGGRSSMTAAAVAWENGRLEGLAAFPAQPKLAARGRADGVGDLWERMHRRGELLALGGKLVNLKQFFEAVAARVAGAEVMAIGSDRYRAADAEVAAAGTPFESAPWHFRGTGAGAKADGSADIRAFQEGVWNGELIVSESLLWLAALKASELRYDVAGNPALARRNRRARNDLIAAAVIACGLKKIDKVIEAQAPPEVVWL